MEDEASELKIELGEAKLAKLELEKELALSRQQLAESKAALAKAQQQQAQQPPPPPQSNATRAATPSPPPPPIGDSAPPPPPPPIGAVPPPPPPPLAPPTVGNVPPPPPPPVIGGEGGPPVPPPPPPMLAGGPPPPPPPPPPGISKLKTAGTAVMAVNAWGNRSKPMNTLNWEKLPTYKANNTLWGDGGATQSLEEILGDGKSLELDLAELEGMFAKPEVKGRMGGGPSGGEEERKAKVMKVTLLDAKRSTSVGIVMKRITDALQGKELRDALMEVDENLLPLEVLPMVLEIAPTAEEKALLMNYTGEVTNLDKPELMLRQLADIPRLEKRLRVMMFKAQLEVDMDGVLMQRCSELAAACKAIKSCKELHALMQIVLNVGNALNAGTSKGNAVGYKLSTLLKIAELKAADKKTTLLHYVVEVVRKNAPTISQPVFELQKVVRDASRISLEELHSKKAEAEAGLRKVDEEITWHDEQRLREGDGTTKDASEYEDQFPEIFTLFYNEFSENKDKFVEQLEEAEGTFKEVCGLLGEAEAKEPEDVFDTLEKFVVRFEAVSREAEEARRLAASQSARTAAAAAAAAKPVKERKQLKSSRPSIIPGGPKRLIGIRPKAAATDSSKMMAPITDGPSAGAGEKQPSGGSGGDAAEADPSLIPQRRMSSSKKVMNIFSGAGKR